MPGWVEAHRDAIASTGMAAVGVAFLAQAFAAESWPLWFAGLVCMFLAAQDPARSVWRHSLRGSWDGSCSASDGSEVSGRGSASSDAPHPLPRSVVPVSPDEREQRTHYVQAQR